MKNVKESHKLTIGRAEEISFDNLHLTGVPAKVDSGAYRSAIHAQHITLSTDGKILTFELLGGHPVCGAMAKRISTGSYKMVTVENSFGHKEERYEVILKVTLGTKSFNSSFSLADRSKKIYPILLGRKLLNGRYIIDTSNSSINRKELKERYQVSFPNDEEDNR